MNRIYAAIAVVVLAIVLALAWDHFITGVEKRGYDRGVSATEARYAKRDNDQLKATLAAQQAAEKRASDAEAKAATAQNLASTNYQKGVQDGKAQTERRIAAARAGTLRLRDPGKDADSASCGHRSAEASPAPAANRIIWGDNPRAARCAARKSWKTRR